jgi:hypothetical protein
MFDHCFCRFCYVLRVKMQGGSEKLSDAAVEETLEVVKLLKTATLTHVTPTFAAVLVHAPIESQGGSEQLSDKAMK